MSYSILPKFDDKNNGQNPGLLQQIQSADFNSYEGTLTSEKLLSFLQELEDRSPKRVTVLFTGYCDARQVMSCSDDNGHASTSPYSNLAQFIYDSLTIDQRKIVSRHLAEGKQFSLAFQRDQVVSSIYLAP